MGKAQSLTKPELFAAGGADPYALARPFADEWQYSE
jgi:hypothetical protein